MSERCLQYLFDNRIDNKRKPFRIVRFGATGNFHERQIIVIKNSFAD